MARLYLILGGLVLCLFTWGQYRGVGLFDDQADASAARGGTLRTTTFHK